MIQKPYYFYTASVLGLLIALLALVTLSTQAGAQEKNIKPLRLHQAIVKSLDSHPSLLSQEYLIKAAEANVAQARVGSRKTAQIEIEDFLGSGNFEEMDTAQSTFSVSWVVENGLLKARENLELDKKSIAMYERNVLRLNIASDTALRFFSVLRYQQELELAKEWLKNVEEMHASIEEYVRAGRLRDTDKYLSLASMSQSRLDVEDLNHEISSARVALGAMWGNTRPDFSRAVGNIRRVSPVGSFEMLAEKVDSSPELMMASMQQQLAQNEVEIVKQDSKIRPTFTAGVRHFSEQDDVSLVAGMSIPLGGVKRNSAKIQALESSRLSQKSDMQVLRLEKITELFELYQAYRHAIHGIEVIEEEIIPALQNALEDTQQAYALGRVTYQDWLSIRKELFQHKIQLIETYYSAHTKKIEMERLIGQPINDVAEPVDDSHSEDEGNH